MNAETTDRTAPRVGGVATALPHHPIDQGEALQALRSVWERQEVDYDAEWLEYFFERVGVSRRHLALELGEYAHHREFGETNDRFIECGTELGAAALKEALARAELPADELDAIFFTTVTGVSSPSLDARIINRLGLDRHIERTPMFGLGCVGGAAGLARMARYLRARPDATAGLVAVELCSLTLERHEPSMADYIAAALFGDGAAAVVAHGAERDQSDASPVKMAAQASAFFHDTEWVMGWEIDERGFGLVLSGDLPEVIETELAGEVDGFLADNGLERVDIGSWISHPGGPKVLEAISSALELDDAALSLSWRSLDEIGNLSSASVLDVLDRTLEVGLGGKPALVLAMGPGFSVEMVLLN
ncbi:MAG: type III polyketide synthase [Persicimonas sp.]